jgi:hypothetical protein
MGANFDVAGEVSPTEKHIAKGGIIPPAVNFLCCMIKLLSLCSSQTDWYYLVAINFDGTMFMKGMGSTCQNVSMFPLRVCLKDPFVDSLVVGICFCPEIQIHMPCTYMLYSIS